MICMTKAMAPSRASHPGGRAEGGLVRKGYRKHSYKKFEGNLNLMIHICTGPITLVVQYSGNLYDPTYIWQYRLLNYRAIRCTRQL